MTDGLKVFVYQVNTGEGERGFVSVLEPDWVFKHGLHPEAIVGSLREGVHLDQAGPEDFQENPAFVRLLSGVLFDHLDQDENLQREAGIQAEGYVYLLDARTTDPGGRVPPEDIIGAVAVTGGQIVADSYQHNSRHRLLTGKGWFRLPQQLEILLLQQLRARPDSQ
ncbi:hypothetical protein F4553_000831 [Allocatelliglobosispora scoriae]|uniref:Uncharacterized protein n=1 Tax=Allocatelliglobosispora scoriae TaxID=643052 RepID=A0A841BL31_9ACTN|nr:hypothetical protein [Allocatelliglobosispora scoriae]MBB5867452.1 hypothetical protein [Allocatelliglobosispora scoriae]